MAAASTAFKKLIGNFGPVLRRCFPSVQVQASRNAHFKFVEDTPDPNLGEISNVFTFVKNSLTSFFLSLSKTAYF